MRATSAPPQVSEVPGGAQPTLRRIPRFSPKESVVAPVLLRRGFSLGRLWVCRLSRVFLFAANLAALKFLPKFIARLLALGTALAVAGERILDLFELWRPIRKKYSRYTNQQPGQNFVDYVRRNNCILAAPSAQVSKVHGHMCPSVQRNCLLDHLSFPHRSSALSLKLSPSMRSGVACRTKRNQFLLRMVA